LYQIEKPNVDTDERQFATLIANEKRKYKRLRRKEGSAQAAGSAKLPDHQNTELKGRRNQVTVTSPPVNLPLAWRG
jgi:hypothetical protein